MNIRSILNTEYDILKQNAIKCPPLEVHTDYTYWVIGNLFNNSCFVIEDENTIIASIMTITTNDIIFIWQIAVLPEYQNKGLSQILYNKVLNYAKSKNINTLKITISIDNQNSTKAFQKFCKNNHLTYNTQENSDINELIYTIKLYK